MPAYRRIPIALLLLSLPAAAIANFAWPPAFYYLCFSLWWVVLSGLAVEFAVHVACLRTSMWKAIALTLISNLTSALFGFVVTWPTTFYERGIDLLVRLGTVGILGTAVLIFAVNVVTEYQVAVRLLGTTRTRRTLLSFVAGNALSFAIVVYAAAEMLGRALSGA